MLILTRRLGQAARVGDNVRVIVKEIRGQQVRLGIEAPADMPVYRDEATDADRERYRVAADERAPVRVRFWRKLTASVEGLRDR